MLKKTFKNIPLDPALFKTKDPKGSLDWWATFYDEHFADFFMAVADGDELEATVDFLRKRLGIQKAQRVFDQCCGNGRLSLPLAEAGAHLVGVDLNSDYIQKATARAQFKNFACDFYAADAYEFVSPAVCDAAFNWYTSFGFAASDDQNFQMLQNAFASLKPGGSYALDYFNAEHVLKFFKKLMRREYVTSAGHVELVRESRIHSSRMEQCWTYVWPDGRQVSKTSSFALYTPGDIAGMFTKSGFITIEQYGDVWGAGLSANLHRCICIGRKPV